ncbi:MAG: hypothetical protein Q8R70_03230 [Methanoregula sp.]|nr:hypothetical protein [Methanoregula sp.]
MPIIVATPSTPQTVPCVPPAQCMMQQSEMGPEGYVKTSEIPCGYEYVIDNDGNHDLPLYCYQQQSTLTVTPGVSLVPLVTSKASGVIARQVTTGGPQVTIPVNTIVPRQVRTTIPQVTRISTGQIVAVAAPNPLPGTGTQVPGNDGTTVSTTMIGRDRFGGETKVPSGTRSLQATTGTPPAFAGELLKNESNRGKILVSLQQQDPAINNIRGDENSLGVDYARKAKLFGVFETRYTETVTVQKNGDIRVDKPWWLAFTTRDDADQMDQMDLQDNLPKQEQAMQTVSSIMKMQNDTVKQIIDNVRG